MTISAYLIARMHQYSKQGFDTYDKVICRDVVDAHLHNGDHQHS